MCNDNLNLAELLGNCPKGIMLYSPLLGEVELVEVKSDSDSYPIKLKGTNGDIISLTSNGLYFPTSQGEYLLYPSKEQRDWSKFEAYKDGDFLSTTDSRAFIFKRYTIKGYPVAYGGINTCDEFISGSNFGDGIYRWTDRPYRKATSEEIDIMMKKMEEAGYIWYQKSKTLIKDIPINTLVIVSDVLSDTIPLNQWVIRRYAGKNRCFSNSGDSICNEGTLSWRHIVPLNKFTVVANGIVEFKKEDDYGTTNF